eukprot:gene4696-5866_t
MSVCSNQHPCNWYNSSIWQGGVVPSVNSSVIISVYNPQPRFPSYSFYSNDSIEISSLVLGGNIALVINPFITFNVYQNITVMNNADLIIQSSTILGSVHNPNGTISISGPTATVNGDITGGSSATFYFNTTGDLIVTGDALFSQYISVSRTCNFTFLGLMQTFSNGIMSSATSTLQVTNAYFGAFNGASFGLLKVGTLAKFESNSVIINQGILTGPKGMIILNSAVLTVVGNTDSYIHQLYSTGSESIAFANGNVQIDQIIGDPYTGSLDLTFANCPSVTIGANDQFEVNKINALHLTGRTNLTTHSYFNISTIDNTPPTNPWTTFITEVELISININNLTEVRMNSNLTNTVVVIEPNSQLSLYAGYKCSQNCGFSVKENSTVALLNLGSTKQQEIQAGGIVFDNYSTLLTFNVLITGGDLQFTGTGSAMVNLYYTMVSGTIYLAGYQSSLNVEVLTSSAPYSLKCNSIQQQINMNTTIDIIFQSGTSSNYPTGIITTDAVYYGPIVIQLNSSSPNLHKLTEIDVLSSKNEMQGDYSILLLDSANNLEQLSKLVHYVFKIDVYSVSLYFGVPMPSWKIGVIVAGSVIGAIILITLEIQEQQQQLEIKVQQQLEIQLVEQLKDIKASSGKSSEFNFNNQTVCTQQHPCNWFDSSIWAELSVPTANSTVNIYTFNQYSSPSIYIYANESLDLYQLYLAGGVSLTVGPGPKTENSSLQIRDGLYMTNTAFLTVNMVSRIGFIANLGDVSILTFNQNSTIYGNVSLSSGGACVFNNSNTQIYDQTSMMFGIFSLFNSNVTFYGQQTSFYRNINGDQFSTLTLNNGYISSGSIGTLNVMKSVSFNYGVFNIYNQFRTSQLGQVKLIGSNIQVFGGSNFINTLSYSYSSILSFINCTSVQIYFIQISFNPIRFHNCSNVNLGDTYISQGTTNILGTLSLSGSTQININAKTNFTFGISSGTTWSNKNQPDNIILNIYQVTNILLSSVVSNCTINVLGQTILNLNAEFKINSGGINVGQFSTLNLIPMYTIGSSTYSYEFGDQGITLGNYSKFYSGYSKITGDIKMYGKFSKFVSNLTFVHGDVYATGDNSQLVINVGVGQSSGVNFKCRTLLQSPLSTINIYLVASSTLKQISYGVKATNADLNGVVNVLMDGLSPSSYKSQSVNVLQTKYNIQGDYSTAVLDSNTFFKFDSFYYKLHNSGSSITVSMENSLASWKIAAIVIGSLGGFIFLVTIIYIGVKRKSHC